MFNQPIAQFHNQTLQTTNQGSVRQGSRFQYKSVEQSQKQEQYSSENNPNLILQVLKEVIRQDKQQHLNDVQFSVQIQQNLKRPMLKVPKLLLNKVQNQETPAKQQKPNDYSQKKYEQELSQQQQKKQQKNQSPKMPKQQSRSNNEPYIKIDISQIKQNKFAKNYKSLRSSYYQNRIKQWKRKNEQLGKKFTQQKRENEQLGKKFKQQKEQLEKKFTQQKRENEQLEKKFKQQKEQLEKKFKQQKEQLEKKFTQQKRENEQLEKELQQLQKLVKQLQAKIIPSNT